MKDLRNKIIKLFIFPWGIFLLCGICYPICVPIMDSLDCILWLKIVVYSLIPFLSLILISMVNFLFQKGIENKYNIYIMIYPEEDNEIDKLVNHEIRNSLLKPENSVVNFIIPSFLQRLTFNRIFKKKRSRKQNFLKSKFFTWFTNRCKPTVILYGTIIKRKENEEKYVFDIGSIYFCDNKNKKISEYVEKNINSTFEYRLMISQNNEITGMNNVNLYIRDIITYIIGLSEFSCLHFQTAFDIHYKLYQDHKSPIFSKKANFKEILGNELSILYSISIYERNYAKARKYILLNKGINSNEAAFLEAQLIMLEANDEKTFRQNVWKAFKLISGLPKNATYYADKGYLSLIVGKYAESEEAYKKLFMLVYQNENAFNGIFDYCKIAEEKEFEKPFIYFLEGMIYKYKEDFEKANQYFNNACQHIGEEHYIYKQSKKEIKEIDEKINNKN